MAEDESFASRWSRLKREAAAAPVPSIGTAPAPAPVELPPLDSLGFESDFTGFLHARVDEKLKQAALKKLFHSPHFNVMDGLDVYIDDYNSFEPIPEEMLRRLNHAQDLLFRDDDQQAGSSASDCDRMALPASDEIPAELATVEVVDPAPPEEGSAQPEVAVPEPDNHG